MEIKWEIMGINLGDSTSLLGGVGYVYDNKKKTLIKTIRSTTLDKCKDAERMKLLYNNLRGLALGSEAAYWSDYLVGKKDKRLGFEVNDQGTGPYVTITYTREPIKTFRFCGLDLDDDLNLIYKSGEISIWYGNIYERFVDSFNSERKGEYSNMGTNGNTAVGLTVDDLKDIIRTLKFEIIGKSVSIENDEVKNPNRIMCSAMKLTKDYNVLMGGIEKSLESNKEEILSRGSIVSNIPTIFQILDNVNKAGTWAGSIKDYTEFSDMVGCTLFSSIRGSITTRRELAKLCGILKIYFELLEGVYGKSMAVKSFISTSKPLKMDDKGENFILDKTKELDLTLFGSMGSFDDEYILSEEKDDCYRRLRSDTMNLTDFLTDKYRDIDMGKKVEEKYYIKKSGGADYDFTSNALERLSFDLSMLNEDSDLVKELLKIPKYGDETNKSYWTAYNNIKLGTIESLMDSKKLKREVLIGALKRDDEDLIYDGDSDINDIVKSFNYKCSNDLLGDSHVDVSEIESLVSEYKEKDKVGEKVPKSGLSIFSTTGKLINKILEYIEKG